MMGTYLLLFVASLCSLILLLAKKRNNKLKKQNVESSHPGCKSPRKYPHLEPILGADLLIKTAKAIYQNRNFPALTERHETLGKTYLVNSIGQNVFFTIDPENFKAVYETHWSEWGVAPARAEALEPFCGRGLINTDGSDWQQLRHMANPIFTSSSLVNLASFGLALDECLDRKIQDGETVDLASVFYHFFLDINGEFLVGKRLGAISTLSDESPPVSPSQFLDAFHGALSWLLVRVFFGILGCRLPNKGFHQNCRLAHSFLDHYINLALNEKNREEPVTPQGIHDMKQDGSQQYGMAGILADQTRNRPVIRSQLLQYTMCIQETTSTLVSNTMFLLSRHRDIWDRLKQDIAGINPKGITSESLTHMTLLYNILRESLRIYPIFATSGRTSLQDTALPRGGGHDGQAPVFVPKHSRIITFFYGLHRDTEVFGEDVEAFRPDRWNGIRPSPWEYLPFSNGPRVCLGKDKAMIEAAYVIMIFTKRYDRIESRDDRAWAGKWALTAKNANGCKVALFSS